MALKRLRVEHSRSFQVNVEDDGEVPLLRIHVVSARGLPRSSGAVGMPDPYVVVKFNGEKVGSTKADRKTRRPEWNQNFMIRSDLGDPDPAAGDYYCDDDEEDDANSNIGDDYDNDCLKENQQAGNNNENSNSNSYNSTKDSSINSSHAVCPAFGAAATAAGAVGGGVGGIGSGGWVGSGRAVPGACGTCRACRRRGIEVVLEVWDRYVPEDEEDTPGGWAKQRKPSIIEPNNLFDDRLFDVSFVSKCFQRGALRRVQGAVIGGNRLIGVCRISSLQLRALGASTVPADLSIRDPRASWWSRSKGTIRVAVSLELLQATIIAAALPPNKAPVGVPLGGGVGAGGVARAAVHEADGEEVLPPAELSCKVLWNGQDFSKHSRWEKGFCVMESNDQLWLDVRGLPGASNSGQLGPTPQSRTRPPPTFASSSTQDSPERQKRSASARATTAMPTSPADEAVVTLESLAAAPSEFKSSSSSQQQQQQQQLVQVQVKVPTTPGGVAAAAAMATAAAAAAAFAVASAGAGAVVVTASAGASAAVATAARAAESMPPPPVSTIAAAVIGRDKRPERERLRRRDEVRRRAVVRSADWPGDQSCVLTVGRLLHLSTFDAQGLADVLNSGEESTERMAGTKEWHAKGFRVHWDGVRRRFTILNVARRSFVLRGGCSSLATELLGFGHGDYVSEPVGEALLDPQQPSDPPRRHMGITSESLPPPLLRPHWMRIVWGPPAMEIARGGELRVQVWARQPPGPSPVVSQKRRRRRSALSGPGQSDDGSWLVGTALLDATEVCRLATGKPTKLPLLSPPALWKFERSKNASAAASAATPAVASGPNTNGTSPTAAAQTSGETAASLSSMYSSGRIGFGVFGWTVTTLGSVLAKQRQRFRRLKRRIAAAGLERCTTPLGVSGANVCWSLPRPPSNKRSGSRVALNGSIVLTPLGRGKRLAAEAVESGEGASARRLFNGGDVKGETLPVLAAGQGLGSFGVVGHVWVSLKLRDPSMLMMRVVRQWHMARDEASEEQRRRAQLEAKRLWMLMPGISLWRVLVQIVGFSLLISYCCTLALRAYHSTRCRTTFNCKEETDPKLASLREWQTLADNLLSAVSFLDMLLQFRTAYVDSSSKIIIDPKKVALHYLRTWFIPDLWCSLPYGTMQPLLQPLLDEVEDAADSLSTASLNHLAAAAGISGSSTKGAVSPLSLWVLKLSKRLHIGKINSIRGTRAFKYLDDSAMGIDLAVKQAVHVVRGRRKVLGWLGNPPKRRGRIGKFFFRIGVTNKWTRIVLSYRLLGYAKVIGTLVRAMRVLAVAIRAVPKAARVLRLAAAFLRSYEGRRRSKDLHEASIIVQRRAGRHMALKVAGRMQANLRRRTRASSDSAIPVFPGAATLSVSPSDRSRGVSAAAIERIGGDYSSPVPVLRLRGRGSLNPPRSPSLANDFGGSVSGAALTGKTTRAPMNDRLSPPSPPAPSDSAWSECSWEEQHDPRSPPRNWTGDNDNVVVTPSTPPYASEVRRRTTLSSKLPMRAREQSRVSRSPSVVSPGGHERAAAGVDGDPTAPGGSAGDSVGTIYINSSALEVVGNGST